MRSGPGRIVVGLSFTAVSIALGVPIVRERWGDDRHGQRAAFRAVSSAWHAPAGRRAVVDAAWSAPADRRADVGHHLFWEAEHPTRTSYPETNPFAPRSPAETNALSGGAWIGAHQPKTSYYLEYDLAVPAAGRYRFYARKFWKHGPFRYRFDEGAFVSIGTDVELLDETSLREHLVVNWVELGTVALSAGRHRLRLELTDDYENGASAWDAFLLSTEPFAPRGKLGPGEPWPKPPDGFFTFDPGFDGTAGDLLDLRHLNENFAGAHGPVVRRGAELGDSRRDVSTRFWGVNVTEDALAFTDESLSRMAASLARRGVNLVRLQARLWKEDDLGTIDPRRLARMHRLARALRESGIYLSLSIYFPLWLKPAERDAFSGYAGDTEAFGLAFFDPRMEAIYRDWWTQILAQEDPQSGRSLATDPSVALLELVNEDSLLFFTFDPYVEIPAAPMARLERQFGAFLESRYGSVRAALRRFGGSPIRGDAPDEGRVGLLGPSEIVRWRTQRARDTAQFLTGLMRSFFERSAAHLRSLGFQGSVVCSNWVTADAAYLGPLDKWANTACDVMDRHGYHGGPHTGDAAAYDVRAGDRYDDASVLGFQDNRGHRDASALDLPIASIEYDQKPMIVSEINWVEPNRFRAEAPFLAAAYGSLQGIDGFAFFAADTPGFGSTLGKFSVSDPIILGQSPAFSLMYRRGYVAEAPPVAHARLGLEELQALRGSSFVAPAALDQLRSGNVPEANIEGARIDPRAFLAGKVSATFVPRGLDARIDPLTELIDEERGIVTSRTRELSWDFAQGLVTLNAPRAQGIVGFVGAAGRKSLSDVSIELFVEYASLVVVSLDGEPLESSKRMLVQVVSEARNTGWSAPGTGQRPIVSIGTPPMLLKEIAGSVEFRRNDRRALRATALDPTGRPVRTLPSLERGLPLLPDVLYYVVEG